ncbi:SIMPL domain-containing protein [Allomuricauda sp. d1]|uniref:SIMPL domain-containing protein n=1 Tax=Allomuricauda sp. d1 TaxID=3136725 RepID=UPI0031E429DA
MKKIVLLTLLFTSFCFTNAQENQNTINVYGVHGYTISPNYKASMLVSMNNVYYDAQTFTLPEILSTYKDKLAKVGINTANLKEDAMGYALYGYDKDGTIIKYTTNSADDLQKFLSVRSVGVTKSDTTMEFKLTRAQMADYAGKALEDAKNRAEALAGKMGRQIGKVVYLSDTNYEKFSESLYYGNINNEREYRINVSFELK